MNTITTKHTSQYQPNFGEFKGLGLLKKASTEVVKDLTRRMDDIDKTWPGQYKINIVKSPKGKNTHLDVYEAGDKIMRYTESSNEKYIDTILTTAMNTLEDHIRDNFINKWNAKAFNKATMGSQG